MTERKAHLDTLAVTLLVSCCFLWGLNQVAAKAAIPEVPPLWQAATRSLGGALLVFLWARLRDAMLSQSMMYILSIRRVAALALPTNGSSMVQPAVVLAITNCFAIR